MIKSYTIQLTVSVFSVLRKEPDEFIKEMRYAAAVKWYELCKISQSKAAEMTGLSRYEFISLLTRYKVSVIQYTKESLEEELKNVC